MSRIIRVSLMGFVALVSVSLVVVAQDFPRPGPEHEELKAAVGTWDAVSNFMGQESRGVMTYSMELGGFWLIGDFVSEPDPSGMKFTGKSMDSYDPVKKKYVSIWIDSMSTSPMLLEGTFDAAKKKLTMTGTGPWIDGSTAKYRTVMENKNPDNQVMKMFVIGPDGREEQAMTITYTRRK